MTLVERVLPRELIADLAAYRARGGGAGLETARKLGSEAVIEDLEASGLRGRGGAGFPTGTKWRTVAANASPTFPTTVVVNGAEGEPGSFKDRAIIRQNPFALLEGALIAATCVGADRVVVAVKATFDTERERLRAAIDELDDAGWSENIEILLAAGPSDYLFGEETALLEALEGGHPFPRIAPPFRHGADEINVGGGPVETDTAAEVTLAAADGMTAGPPTLVNNVETMTNVPAIVVEGPDWFREVGTDQSPGTIVCTVSGHTQRAGVAEFALGTPLAEIIDQVGGGARDGQQLTAALSGVSNPVLPAARFDLGASYEAMAAAGTGLGAAGFIVFDDTVDPVAIAEGVSRFLAVESCGQCTPCKSDGLIVAGQLDRLRRTDTDGLDLQQVDDCLATITDGARCFLAHQHQQVVSSLLELFVDDVRRHAERRAEPAARVTIAPLIDLVDGEAIVDPTQATKNPDWTHDRPDSGRTPVDRLRGT
jgi:NADH:ubiquinone oxidoreductase subunit F (NADH-binding)